eukprot:gene8793-18187_t
MIRNKKRNRNISCSGLSISADGTVFEHLNQYESELLYEEIFLRHVYMKNGIVISEGSVIIDVGANIGLFSLYCINILRCKMVVAIEPIPPIFDVLRRNLSSKSDHVKIVHTGISGDKTATQHPFHYYQYHPGESTRHPHERKSQRLLLMEDMSNCTSTGIVVRDEETGDLLTVDPSLLGGVGVDSEDDEEEEHGQTLSNNLGDGENSDEGEVFMCRMVTLERIITELGIESVDLLKIDVEGDELGALIGLGGVWSRINQIVVEVHDTGGRLQAVLDLLTGKAFSCIIVPQEPEVVY